MSKRKAQGVDRATRRHARHDWFLFDPDAVGRELNGLPNLAALLGDPHREGATADTLKGARKSPRHLFRVLGNTHFEPLSQLLTALDACAGAGFRQPEILRTRAGRPFAEALAEAQVADHFRRHGYSICGFDETKAGTAVPDVFVEGHGLAAAVEVYCPREWLGLEDYTDAITNRIKNIDRSFEFGFRIRHEQLRQFDDERHLLHLHPGRLSDCLDEATRLSAVTSLLEEITVALDAGTQPRARFDVQEINLGTTVELNAVATASTAVPARAGIVDHPSIGAYRPEAMFEADVDRIIAKLKKSQAVNIVAGAVPVLVVEMSRSELTSELYHTAFYRPHFEQTIQEKLGDLHGYGIVAFTEFLDWQRPLFPHFLVIDDSVDHAIAHALFPGKTRSAR